MATNKSEHANVGVGARQQATRNVADPRRRPSRLGRYGVCCVEGRWDKWEVGRCMVCVCGVVCRNKWEKWRGVKGWGGEGRNAMGGGAEGRTEEVVVVCGGRHVRGSGGSGGEVRRVGAVGAPV